MRSLNVLKWTALLLGVHVSAILPPPAAAAPALIWPPYQLGSSGIREVPVAAGEHTSVRLIADNPDAKFYCSSACTGLQIGSDGWIRGVLPQDGSGHLIPVWMEDETGVSPPLLLRLSPPRSRAPRALVVFPELPDEWLRNWLGEALVGVGDLDLRTVGFRDPLPQGLTYDSGTIRFDIGELAGGVFPNALVVPDGREIPIGIACIASGTPLQFGSAIDLHQFQTVPGGVTPFTAAGGVRFAVAGLPEGLFMDEATGELEGASAEPGDWNGLAGSFEAYAASWDGGGGLIELVQFPVNIHPPVSAVPVLASNWGEVVMSPSSFEVGVGVPFAQKVHVGYAEASLIEFLNLPEGVRYDAATSMMSGTMAASGSTGVDVRIFGNGPPVMRTVEITAEGVWQPFEVGVEQLPPPATGEGDPPRRFEWVSGRTEFSELHGDLTWGLRYVVPHPVYDLAVDGDRMVAAGLGGLVTSVDGGANWEETAPRAGGAVCCGGGIFVSSTNGWSSDGVHWNAFGNIGFLGSGSGALAYGGGKFVMADGDEILHSEDGHWWERVWVPGVRSSIGDVHWSDGCFYARADSRTWFSLDGGATWDFNPGEQGSHLAVGGGTFVRAGPSVWSSSPSTRSWEERNRGLPMQTITELHYFRGRFIARSNDEYFVADPALWPTRAEPISTFVAPYQPPVAISNELASSVRIDLASSVSSALSKQPEIHVSGLPPGMQRKNHFVYGEELPRGVYPVEVRASLEGALAGHHVMLIEDGGDRAAPPHLEGEGPAAVGAAYSGTLRAPVGEQPVRFGLWGAPAWMTFDAASGAVGGVPERQGRFEMVAWFEDPEGRLSYGGKISLEIDAPAPPLSVAVGHATYAGEGTHYAVIEGATPSTGVALEGAPDGVEPSVVRPTTGVGTAYVQIPVAGWPQGRYPLTLRVNDGETEVSVEFIIAVGPGGEEGGFLWFEGVGSAEIMLYRGWPMRQSVPREPGDRAVAVPLLPDGLSVDASTGEITGITTELGSYRSEVFIERWDGSTEHDSLGITIVEPPAPEAQIEPSSLTGLAGGGAQLRVHLNVPEPVFHWSFEGRELEGGDKYHVGASGTLSISDLDLADAGRYLLTVRSALVPGVMVSADADLAVVESFDHWLARTGALGGPSGVGSGVAASDVEAFAAGSKPDLGAILSVSSEGGFPVVSLRRPTDRTGLTYALIESYDLENWNQVQRAWERVSTDRSVETLRMYIPDGLAERHYRVRASLLGAE